MNVNDMPNVVIHDNNGAVVPKNPTNNNTSQPSNPACIADGTFSAPAGATGCSCTHDGCSASTSVCSCTGGGGGGGQSSSSNGGYTFTVDGKTGRIDPDGKAYNDQWVYSGNYNFTTGVYTDHNGWTVNVNNTPSVVIRDKNGAVVPKNPTNNTSTPTATTPFSDFEEYKAWEARVYAGAHFAADYQTPDYIRMMGLAQGGGNEEAYKRYLFFKANPQYAEDYANIYQGKKSQFPTDGSTLIKSNLNDMPADVAAYYRENPAALRAAEWFSMDPVLARKVYTGEIKLPYWVNATTWLQTHKWTQNGVVENNNLISLNNNPYIGINGTWGSNYRQMRYDTTTGMIVDFDGTLRDPVTGEARWKVDPNKFYGSGASYPSSAISSTSSNSSSNTSNTVSPTGATNIYTALLPNSITSKLNQFVDKIKAKRSSYSNDTQYNAFLDAFSTKLTQLKTNTKFINNTTIQNIINYLVFEIKKIRG